MADIKCPMCGKTNPAEAEVCKYCQARLKPLTFSNKGSGAVPTPSSGGDEADWLRNLAASHNPPAPDEPAEIASEPEPGAEEPDWLSRIRQKTKEEEDAVSLIGRPPKIEPGTPLDPRSAVSGAPTKPTGPLAPPAPSTGDDWLHSLRSAHLEAEPPAAEDGASEASTPSTLPPAPSSSPAMEDLDNDEWLASLNARLGTTRGNKPPVPPAAEDQPAASEPLPLTPLSSQQELIGKSQSPADDVPEWLKSFDSAAGPVPESAPSEDSAAPANIPDWLKGYAGEPPAAAAPVSPAAPAAAEDASSDLTDWLKSFSASQAAPADSGQPPFAGLSETPTPSNEPTASTWLGASQAEEPLETPSEPGAAPAEMPDWLKAFAAAAPTQPAVPQAQAPIPAIEEPEAAPAEMPDWMKAFAAEQPVVSTTAPAQPSVPLAEPPFESAAESEAAPAEMPDWLKTFAVEQPAVPAVPAQPTPPTVETSIPGLPEPEAAPAEMPDWLKTFAAEQPAVPAASAQPTPPVVEAPTPVSPEPEAAAAEMPDWLKSFAAEQPAVPAAPAQPTPSTVEAPTHALPEPEAAAAEMPDWLKTFAAEQPAASMTAPAEPTPPLTVEPGAASSEPEAVPGEIPDWLKDFATSPAASQETSPAEKPAIHDTGALLGGINRHTGELILPASMAKNEEIPDWLKSYSHRETEPPATAPEPEPEPEPEEPAHVSPFSESTLPDWMFNEKGGQPPSVEPGGSFELPAGEPIGVEASGPARPFAGEEVSQWLDTSAAEQAVSDEAAKSRQGDLEMAPLPAWLQAMRPVESAAPPTTDNVDEQRIEKSGPLAGLRGILRGEDLVTQYQKPPTYSVKLRVSEPQTSRASLLETVVGAEAKSQQVPSESQGAPHLVVRIATGLALVALILIVIMFGPKPLTPAALSDVDPQAIAINSRIENLSPSAPVLVAVDYGGGLAGEMNIVAQPVLQHLMAKNARIIFVSTQIEGPALAESLFSTARSSGGSAYPPAFEANLGYVLGGSTALKVLAASPLRTALPVLWSGDRTWSQTALQGLSLITDFSQVILLTDTPENARDWIEQVQPELAKKNVPLIVISSAQAAPMLRPYQQSGQITALLSGLTGGTAYEQIRQVRGTGTTSYNAYLAGILAMTLFILMGGIVSLGSRIFTSKPKRKV